MKQDDWRSAFNSECERLDKHLESQRYFLRSTMGIASFLVIGFGALALFLLGSSISELKQEVITVAQAAVQREINTQADNASELAKIGRDLRNAKAIYEDSKAAIEALSYVKDAESIDERDPSGAYTRLSEIEAKYYQKDDIVPTPEDRAAALALLEKIIESSRAGIAEPNLIFNAAVSASRLNFHSQAVQLAVLAEYWQSTTAHRVLVAEFSHLYGRSYKFDGDEIKQDEGSPEDVRANSWKQLEDILVSMPRQESEQAYSRAFNMATRSRGAGSYEQLIALIEASLSAKPDRVTSYALANLAQLYSMQGDADWRQKYWETADLAIDKLREESPATSWYEHTLRDLLKSSDAISERDEMIKRLARIQPDNT
ncbi:MAG: hypothetical protein OXR62_15945 [Ahrensia sp.]|nr:hypothetical protein [Ahrensia sp.]